MKHRFLSAGIAAALFIAPLDQAIAGQPVFALHSADFAANALMPERMGGNNANNPACRGENQSPALAWENPPADTRSFALIVHDAQGKNGLGVTHLVAYGIPATSRSLAAGALSQGNGFIGGKNSAGQERYAGPCPPQGVDTHYYTFTLIATDLAPDALPAGLTREALLERLQGHALRAAGLVGGYAPVAQP